MKYDPETGIFIGEHRYKLDSSLVNAIGERFKGRGIKKVADIGCGPGHYSKRLNNFGWEVDGFEGNIPADKEYDKIYHVDLTMPIDIDTVYDLVLCLEVGEHIPLKHQATFVKNVVKMVGKYLILSWALPNQKGKGHVSCLKRDKVIDLFYEYGLHLKQDDTDFLRGKCEISWLKKSLIVFEVCHD